MYEKFKFESSLASNMTFRSNLHYSMTDVPSDGVNEYVLKVED